MMSTRKLRFAIFGNVYQPKKSVSIQKILACLSQYEAEVFIEREFYTFITEGQQMSLKGVNVFDNNQFEADFAISMGGDGTFLRTASVVGQKQIPILGINTGRLGFLADVNAQEIEHTIHALHDEDYAVDTRAVIQVETKGQELQGYNCALKTLTTYQADGLIISTPTGSTAYSLSVGGPIIVPGTHVFSLTAVAPHSLNVRPIVVSEDSVIELSVESRTHNFLVALDGRSEKLDETTQLTLRRAPYRVQVIKRAGTKYFHTLREKMMWGADQRG